MTVIFHINSNQISSFFENKDTSLHLRMAFSKFHKAELLHGSWQNMTLGSAPVYSLSPRPVAEKIECCMGDLSLSRVSNPTVVIEALAVAKVKAEVRPEVTSADSLDPTTEEIVDTRPPLLWLPSLATRG